MTYLLPEPASALATQADVQTLATSLDERFEQVDERFERVDERFEQVDQRFERVDERFEQVDGRFEQVDERLDRIERGVEKLDDRYYALHETLRDQLRQYFLVSIGAMTIVATAVGSIVVAVS